MRYAKAFAGAVIAGLGTLQVALADGVTTEEWVGIAITTVVALAGVWAIPNSQVQT